MPARMEFLPLLESPLDFWIPTADCAVRHSALEARKPDGSVDLHDVPLIVPERGVTKETLDRWFAAQGMRPRIYAQVAGHEAIVAMVALGLGVGVAPELVVEAGAMSSQVESLGVSEGLPSLNIGLCGLRQRLASPLVRSVWDVAAQTYPRAV